MAAGREPSHQYLSGGGDGEHECGHGGTAEVEQTTLGRKGKKNKYFKIVLTSCSGSNKHAAKIELASHFDTDIF